jgi:asparagine synthase (glutamine-hydrolysing)
VLVRARELSRDRASVDGELRVQGTAYGTRRVYHSIVDGVVVAADRAAALAEVTGAPADMGALDSRLLLPQPFPLGSRPMWTGVHAV